MSLAGQFPKSAGTLSAHGAPVVATVVQVTWSLVLLWTASFEWMLLYSGVGFAAFSMLSVAAVFVLRYRKPGLPRPFRTPGYPYVPAIYLVGTVLLTGAVIYERPDVSMISLLSIALSYCTGVFRSHNSRDGSAPKRLDPPRESITITLPVLRFDAVSPSQTSGDAVSKRRVAFQQKCSWRRSYHRS